MGIFEIEVLDNSSASIRTRSGFSSRLFIMENVTLTVNMQGWEGVGVMYIKDLHV